MAAKPTLESFTAPITGANAVGFRRTDGVSIIHVIAQAKPGTRFMAAPHFRSCMICRVHQITEDDFATFMNARGAIEGN